MNYAVELYLDKKTEQAISELASRLAGEDQGRRPRFQITLGRFSEQDETKAAERLKKVVRQHKKNRGILASLGIFSGNVILVPALSDFLYTLYVDVHEAFRFPGEGFERFAPGSWLPHLVIGEYGEDRSALLDAFHQAAQMFEPITGDYERLALVRTDAAQKEVCSFKLRD